MSGRTGPAHALELDAAAADGLALITLLTSGVAADVDLAEALLDEFAPDADRRIVRGLASVAAGLLALLEFYGGIDPQSAVRLLGSAIAQAET
jgi:hypothetical protein